MRWVALSVMVAVIVGGVVMRSGRSPSADQEDFDAFLVQFEERTRQFMGGDAAGWLDTASRGADVSIMGAWGAQEVGWNEVEARYRWAVGRFRESGATLQVDYLSRVVGADLAVTVAMERATVWLADQPAPAPMALRVTHVFRREGGAWRLVHRHADPLVTKVAQDAVLQR